MKILGIDTSCDETSAAVVADGTRILSNIVASQIDIHSRYGGIVPEVASRQHLLTIIPVVKRSLEEANIGWNNLNGIAVTFGPGLAGSLLVGVNFAKGIALASGLPLIGINHLEGHIYANWLEREPLPVFPSLCLIVSGGHTNLILMRGHGEFEHLGRTRDDAAGEAFDKAARILHLGYPGGPAIEEAASSGTPRFTLPRAWLKGTNDFSFSGVKTALWHLIHKEEILNSPARVADAAASFQNAVVEVLVTKTIEAARKLGVRQIILGGGVAANKPLRYRMLDASPVPIIFPPSLLCTDNAAMIAACGYYKIQQGLTSDYDLDVVSGLSLD